MRQDSFWAIITAAVADIQEHGYDSEDRVQQWVARIRAAALRDLTPLDVVERELRNFLTVRWTRAVEGGAILKMHPDVSLFTVQRVKPKLRGELDRRLQMARGLIKDNREQAIARTAQRFRGWASSIPAGGSDAVERNPVKTDIRKALAQLPFEERRVAIDQGMKMISSVSNIIATDGGAIAVFWNDHGATDPSYDARHSHMMRNGKCYAIRGNWALEQGLMKPGPQGYYEDITAFGEEVYCFPASTKIPYADGVEKAYRRFYEGRVVTLLTASGKMLTGTPNHPVLTPLGWLPMGALNEGDDIIEVADEIGHGSEEDHDHAIPSIVDLFGAIDESGIRQTTDHRPAQFHGDGCTQGEVDIVSTTRPLRVDWMASVREGLSDLDLPEPLEALSGGRTLDQGFNRSFGSANRIMRWLGKGLALLCGKASHSQIIGLRTRADGLPFPLEVFNDDGSGHPKSQRDGKNAIPVSEHWQDSADIEVIRPKAANNHRTGVNNSIEGSLHDGLDRDTHGVSDLLKGLPFATKTVKLIKIDSEFFAGHVYNLQTVKGHYVANGLIAHNCRCFGTYIYAVRRLPDYMITAKGREKLEAVKKMRAGA